ncbi:MAG: radical SAM protein [Candidatus Woesearchaeota archaeon]
MKVSISKLSNFIRNNLDLVGVLDGKEAFKGPEMLHIDLTNMCNNQCLACWCRSPLLRDKFMTPEEQVKTLPTEIVKGILDDAYSMGTRQLKYVGGGEPFMHPNALELIEYATKKGFALDINTNFTLVTEEIARKLVDWNVDLMTVSVWAATPQTYAATHANQTGETFSRIVKVLKFINNYKKETGKVKPTIKLYNVIFDKNYHEINEMVELAFETGSEAVQFVAMDPVEGRTDVLLLKDEERNFLLKEIEELKKRIDPATQTISSPKREYPLQVVALEEFERRIRSEKADKGIYDESVIKHIPCYAGWMFSRVMANGNVVPCCKGYLKPMGNVYSKRFKQIWEDKLQKEFRYKGTHLPLTDPYFVPFQCIKTCDNLWQNEPMHQRVKSLTKSQRFLLKSAALYLKLRKKFTKNNTQ